MHMFFWWDYIVKNFLIYNVNISSILQLVITCLGMVLVTIFFEWLKLLQAKVRQKRILLTQRHLQSMCPPNENDSLIPTAGALSPDQPSTSAGTGTTNVITSQSSISPSLALTERDRVFHFATDMSLWVTQNILGYLLMLVVMLYNGYIVIGIVVGSAVGYFFCGPTLIRLNIENCRAMRNTFCMADCSEPDKTALLGSSTINMVNQRVLDTPPICHQTTVTAEIVSDAR